MIRILKIIENNFIRYYQMQIVKNLKTYIYINIYICIYRYYCNASSKMAQTII